MMADLILTALAARVGDERAEALLTRLGNFSNHPNTIKGAAKLASEPEIETAALELIQDPALGSALGLQQSSEGRGRSGPTQETWGLLVLAARADIGVLDRLPAGVDGVKLAAIRRAQTRRAKAASAAPAAGQEAAATPAGPDVPQRVSEVKRWLAANPGVDPELLAPFKGQRAAARVAAIRSLGALATPEALSVLARYAHDEYPDADLAELHRAWANFDRREFAATMFRPSAWTLNLGVASSLEGIDAVENLTSLDVIFLGAADLTPLAGCDSLRRLKIISNVEPSVTSLEPLTHLPHLRTLHLSGVTRNADLSVLAGTQLTDLQISLDGADASFLVNLPRLRTLTVSGGSAPEDGGAPREDRGPQPIPAHPDLPEVVYALVRSGVEVVVYKHERGWVTELVEEAENAGIEVEEAGGRFTLTKNGIDG